MPYKRLTKNERVERLQLIIEMREDDRSMQYIAVKLGISRQRVHTILKIHAQNKNGNEA